MSEETPTPALRLKPRARPDSSASAQAGTTPSAVSASPSPLSSEQSSSAPAAEAAAVTTVAAAPAPTPAPEPAAPAPSPFEGVDPGRFKLRPRQAPANADGSPAAAPSLPADLPPPVSPAAASAAAQSSAPLIAGGMKVSSSLPATLPQAPKPPSASSKAPPQAATAKSKKSGKSPEASAAFRFGLYGAGAVVALTLAVGGFLAFRSLVLKEKQGSSKPVAKATAPANKPTPTAQKPATPALGKGGVVDKPESTAGKLVAKARDTVAAREESGQVKGVDDVLDAEKAATPAPAKSAEAPTGEVSLLRTPRPATPSPSSSDPAQPAPPPPASPAFRAYVSNLRINGVFQGEPARALVNGRMVRAGEMVDNGLGVRFLRLEPDAKQIYFEDSTGAQVSRRY